METKTACPDCGNTDSDLIEDNGYPKDDPVYTLLCVECGHQWEPGMAKTMFAVIRQVPAGYYVVHSLHDSEEAAQRYKGKLDEQNQNCGWGIETRIKEVPVGTRVHDREPGSR